MNASCQEISMVSPEPRGPQLLLQEFLQKIVNSGGRIEREYSLGLDDVLVILRRNAGQAVNYGGL